jgi:hypothetical protein
MTKSDLYVYCDIVKKEILENPQSLEENWKNISGLVYLSDDELKDLSWAGYSGVGFINISNNILFDYQYPKDLMTNMKVKLKNDIEYKKCQKEIEGVIINNKFNISLSSDSKISLLMKYLECKETDFVFDFLTVSGTVKLSSTQFINIFNSIQKYINDLLQTQIDLFKKIDGEDELKNLLKLNHNTILWPTNDIKILIE